MEANTSPLLQGALQVKLEPNTEYARYSGKLMVREGRVLLNLVPGAGIINFALK